MRLDEIQDEESFQRLKDLKGKRVEIVAFDIAYRGTLAEVDWDRGTLKIVEGDHFAILELERIESFMGLD